MNIPKSDIEKIQLITVAAQVNDVVSLLSNIDKESLITAIRSTLDEDKGKELYQFMIHTLDFYEKISEVLFKEIGESNNEQSTFNY